MVRALVSNVQRYSTKDGPGIRTTVFLTGCTLRCRWCSNPELLQDMVKVLHFRVRCHKCGECIRIDPTVKMMEDGAAAENSLHKEEMLKACPFDAFEYNSTWYYSEQLVAELLKDRVYFETSGGGVTVSGGEPLMHTDFVIDVLKRLKAEGIHTCIDTAGNVPSENFERVLPYVDLVLFDIKAYDSEIHRRCTECSNDRILENFRMLAERKVPMWIRMPVVGGMNDDDEDFRSRLKLVRDVESVAQIDVLCYHEYGLGKYKALGMEYNVKDGHIDDVKAARLQQIADEEGVAINLIRE